MPFDHPKRHLDFEWPPIRSRAEDNLAMAQESNVCAGPFGAVYDFYIERPWLARLVLGTMWGVDPLPFFRSLNEVAELSDGSARHGPNGPLSWHPPMISS
jgi:hypothetical protein